MIIYPRLDSIYTFRRFTLTTDANVSKSKIMAVKEESKEVSRIRSKLRKLRRMLSEVSVGVLASGSVQGIVPEGVLVSVYSLGSMNVTGLISAKSLPTQFQAPSISSDFQQYLLEHDFWTGRKLTCSIARINPSPNPRIMYNMKLEFED